mgnify:CR=1 FL=1
MKPMMQTRMGINGNCEAACIASILECDINDVPQIRDTEDYEHRYFKRLSMWLRSNYGVYYVHCPLGDSNWKPQGWSVGAIQSDLVGQYTHAVVCFDGKIVYDPLGNPANFEKPILGHTLFVVYDLEILFDKAPKHAMPSRKWLMKFSPEFRRPFLEASAEVLASDDEEHIGEDMEK